MTGAFPAKVTAAGEGKADLRGQALSADGVVAQAVL